VDRAGDEVSLSIPLSSIHATREARYVAAGELGSGIFVNPVSPTHAAGLLRSG